MVHESETQRSPSTSTGTNPCPDAAICCLFGKAPWNSFNPKLFMSQREPRAPAIRAETAIRFGSPRDHKDAKSSLALEFSERLRSLSGQRGSSWIPH